MVFFATFLLNLFGLGVALLAIIITFFKWKFSYWARRNVPFVPPSIPFGNVQNIFTSSSDGNTYKNWYDSLKSQKAKLGGIFFLTVPQYVIVDLDLVRSIFVKDFQYFTDRGVYYNEELDPLGAQVFTLGGKKWKSIREKLTLTFTAKKMKMMFETMLDCVKDLQIEMESLFHGKRPIDIKELFGSFTLNVIGSCAFGLDCESFKDSNCAFKMYAKKMIAEPKWTKMKHKLIFAFPEIAAKLKTKLIPEDISDFFFNVVKDTVEYREKSNFVRKDFLQILIDLKNGKLEKEDKTQNGGKTITIEEIAAQSFLFFVAGFETSATTATFALYELAKNQDIQDKVREEISTVLQKYDNDISYDSIQEMKFLSQVISETLRKYPPAPAIRRKCVKDYQVPGENMTIEKNFGILVPVLGIHRDEEYYPDPDKFDPERFSAENVKSRHSMAYIPFGEGPRICLGLRFGLMQLKIGLISLLRKYRFTVNQKTKQPFQLNLDLFFISADGGIWLDAEKIE